MISRMQDDCPATASWVEASANPAYERHLMDLYDASLVNNGSVEPSACYWYD